MFQATPTECAQNAERAGDGLVDIDTGAWEGKAGQAFRDKFSYEPSKWYDAANCLRNAVWSTASGSSSGRSVTRTSPRPNVADAQAELGEASRLLDHSEQYVPRINP